MKLTDLNSIANWKKLGLIFQPKGRAEWAHSHAWVPTVETVGDGLVRVYFGARNANNLSQIGAFTMDLDNPKETSDFTENPLLELGPLGSFDDSAVLPSCIVNHDGQKLLYYIGWTQGKRIPYFASIGLAISQDRGKTFVKISRAPLIGRSEVDPFFTAASYVRVEENLWRMWYTTNTEWRIVGEEVLPRYHIKYAESDDGINWDRNGIVAIDFDSPENYVVARPWVEFDNGLYRMWYSYRGSSYRIGYAESKDGTTWTRLDHAAGIDVSAEGFDSEMIEYAAVVRHKGKKFMFYNGNNYGEDGIGLAVSG